MRAGNSSGGYTTLQPRQELTPTPYALYAQKTGTVDWGNISGIPADIADGDNGGSATYAYRIVVAKSGGDYSSIQTALDSISDNSPEKRYLIWVAPGIYSEWVVMKPWVDIEGSGELATEIRAEGSNNSFTGTVVAANNAELRWLTVKSVGGPSYQYAVALYNPVTLARFSHVTAEAYNAPSTYALYNYGLANAYIAPEIDYITAKAYGGQKNIGIFNHYASPKLSYLVSYAYNGAFNYGVYNLGAAGAPVKPEFSYLESYAYDGGKNYAFYNVYATPKLAYVGAYAYDGDFSYGIYNGSERYNVWLDNTLIEGDTGTIYTTATFSTYVGGSKLAGGNVQNQGGVLKCAGVYDDEYNFYDNSCFADDNAYDGGYSGQDEGQ